MNWLAIIPYLKALHIIGFVTWFAGLFYLVRLFVYHAEAAAKAEPERSILKKQFALMEWRLFYIITWPGMVLTLICGISMIVINPYYLQGWMHLKLTLVAALVVYHFWCGEQMKKLAAGKPVNGGGMRMMNEVATLLLVAIVFLAVMRSLENFLYGFLGFIAFAALMFAGIALYKKLRRD